MKAKIKRNWRGVTELVYECSECKSTLVSFRKEIEAGKDFCPECRNVFHFPATLIDKFVAAKQTKKAERLRNDESEHSQQKQIEPEDKESFAYFLYIAKNPVYKNGDKTQGRDYAAEEKRQGEINWLKPKNFEPICMCALFSVAVFLVCLFGVINSIDNAFMSEEDKAMWARVNRDRHRQANPFIDKRTRDTILQIVPEWKHELPQ